MDTSALIKLYHKEKDSEIIEDLFAQEQVTHVFLSELAKIEFYSAIWKKVRTNDINKSQAEEIISLFKSDFVNYNFVPIDDELIDQSLELIELYGQDGLRILDSIQFATICILEKH